MNASSDNEKESQEVLLTSNSNYVHNNVILTFYYKN